MEMDRAGTAGLLPLYTAALFVSALLLFAVQPMFTKMVLPMLGGSPGVWNTAMLFFQSVLLAGYGYAHLTTRVLGVRRQAFLHLAVMVIALAALPIGVAAGWTPPHRDGASVLAHRAVRRLRGPPVLRRFRQRAPPAEVVRALGPPVRGRSVLFCTGRATWPAFWPCSATRCSSSPSSGCTSRAGCGPLHTSSWPCSSVPAPSSSGAVPQPTRRARRRRRWPRARSPGAAACTGWSWPSPRPACCSG